MNINQTLHQHYNTCVRRGFIFYMLPYQILEIVVIQRKTTTEKLHVFFQILITILMNKILK